MQKAITYHILSTPSVQKKLRAELDAADLSFPPQYNETKDLPYLNAVIREGMRMHPVIGGILERYVPASGLALPDGRVIAPGTKVGINPWVSTRNTEIYGEDAAVFRPERWFKANEETEDTFDARLKRMKDADFTFGSGNRSCVGRHMANVEIHKITTTLFSRYDVSHLDCLTKTKHLTDVPCSYLSTPTLSNGRHVGGGSRLLTTSMLRSSDAQMCPPSMRSNGVRDSSYLYHLYDYMKDIIW